MGEFNHHLFKSEKADWATPPEFFDRLDQEFHFNLDACASAENAKCSRFLSLEDDALTKRWDGTVFMNPPYGNEISKWARKAYNESQHGAIVVALLPARTDVKWW